MPQATGTARPRLVKWMLGLGMGIGIVVVAAAGLGLVSQVGEDPDGSPPGVAPTPGDGVPTGQPSATASETPDGILRDRLVGRWAGEAYELAVEPSGSYSLYESGELVESGELRVYPSRLEVRPTVGEPYSVDWALPPPYDELTVGEVTLSRQ